MASKNIFESKRLPSTSKVSDYHDVNSVAELTELLKIKEEVLDVDEVIRSFVDEYKKLKAGPAVHIDANVMSKSNTRSAELRLAAESHAKLRLHVESLPWYARSIAFAEDGSKELALAYGKRAESLHRLRLYDDCIDDIKRALAAKYPASKKKKLQSRLYQCFTDRRKASAAKRQVKLVQESGSSSKIVEVGSISAILSANATETENDWQNMCKFENDRIPNASSKIRLGYDEQKWGRFVEATEDLEAGEVVARQEWFLTILKEKLRYERCSLCFTLCAALIPCLTCSQVRIHRISKVDNLDIHRRVTRLRESMNTYGGVGFLKVMYCSEKCRGRAYDAYHRLECKMITQLLKSEEVNDVKYRVVVKILLKGTKQGAQLGNLMQRLTVRDLMTTTFPAYETFDDEYASYLRLDKRYLLNGVKGSLQFAARVVAVLENAGYFDGDPSFRADSEHQDTLTEAQIFTAFLLLNNAVGMIPYFITMTTANLEWTSSSDNRAIGVGYLTLFPLFNHSCDPNIFLISRNQESALITSRPIKKGEQLFVSYGTLYITQEFLERNKLLCVFHGFICQCAACLNEWPTGNILEKAGLEFYDHVKQKKAKSELKTLMLPVADVDKFKALPLKEIFPIFHNICKWFYANIKHPACEHRIIENIGATFMTLQYDDFLQYFPVDFIMQHTHAFLLNVAKRLSIDLNTIPALTENTKKKKS